MKEHPILFSGPMVRAILEGRKTQTRRIMKPQPTYSASGTYCDPYNGNYEHFTFWTHNHKMLLDCPGNVPRTAHWRCPLGVPGDHLWVREEWAKGWTYAAEYPCVFYKADGLGLIGDEERPVSRVAAGQCGLPSGRGDARAPHDMKWKPSIHMPRWASRITLEVIGVRVERLQSISDSDCWAEGIDEDEVSRAEHFAIAGSLLQGGSPERCAYAGLWESIYGPGSWETNPWVWVVSFRRLEAMSRDDR